MQVYLVQQKETLLGMQSGLIPEDKRKLFQGCSQDSYLQLQT